ncbi:MAG: tetratricopeptide repeat protein [Gammaproteobacteria bacterium]
MNRKDQRRLHEARRKRQEGSPKGNGSGSQAADIDAALGQVTALLQSGHPSDARKLSQALLAEHPEDPRALNLGAIACFQTDDAATATALLDAAIRLQPDFVDAHNNLGNVLKARGDFIRAETAYRHAIDLAPTYFDALFNLGIVLEAMGRPGEARDTYGKALDVQPDFLPAYLNTGNALKALGKFEEALDYYRWVLEVEPRNVDALNNMGAVSYELTRFDDAESTYRNALEIDAEHADTLYNLGVLLQETERFDEAVDAYQRAVAARPHYTECHVNLGYTMHQLGRLDEARASYERAVELDPDNAQAQVNLGDLFLARGDPDAARGICDTFLARHAGDTGMLAFKTIALRETGDVDGARELADTEKFLHKTELTVPKAFADRDSFNRALADHICAHPSLVDAPASKATRQGKHSGELLVEPKGPMAGWEARLREAIEEYRAALPGDPSHPFVCSMPERYRLTAWSVVLERQGHQIPHIHPSAWLSGVYYVALPDTVAASSEDTAGWIEFGQPPDHYHGKAPPELVLEKPREGLLFLFPSYFYHRTIPFDTTGRRISIAFDVVPYRGP